MTTEFMRYEGHRFLLYKRWDYAPHGRTEEQTEALEAGKTLFKAANFEHWASQPKLVERIQNFLVSSIPSYRPNPYGESPRNIVNALCWELRNGTALIVRAKPAYIAHDGFVPARTEEQKYQAELADRAERGRLYEARSKAHDDDFRAYRERMDERAASEASALQKPFRHIETVTEAGVRNRAAWAARDALAALASAAASVVASSLPSMDDDVFDLGEVSEMGAASTPLGDAAPFEYSASKLGGNLLSIAARSVSESHEAGCFAEYESELDLCNALAPAMSGARGTALCKQNAFDRYQQCRGY
jgi:hypothetical protein